ncbi:unnamed protein product [Lampetra planeri]
MALAQAAYPRMDDVGLDSIVLEKILLLAPELRIAVHVKDEANLSSLGAAHYLHTELLLQRDGQVAACATRAAARKDENCCSLGLGFYSLALSFCSLCLLELLLSGPGLLLAVPA